MIDIYVLDKSLQLVGVIDAYKSLIWANRYSENGDCELYLAASEENIAILSMGYYLTRLDDDMVCRIRRIEIDTDTEEGNYLIVTGADSKSYLDQRIIWLTSMCNGNVETFIRQLVTDALISPTDTDRTISLITLGTTAGFSEVTTEQVSYRNLGEKIREYCQKFGWGYRFVLNSNNRLEFQLYKGTDRSDEVTFSDQYENLSSTNYIDSCEDMTNVALVGGEGEGSERKKAELGTATGTDRYEIFVDADNISSSMTYAEVKSDFPGGYIAEHPKGNRWYYVLQTLDIPIVDSEHLTWLQASYSGTVVTVGGIEYFRCSYPVYVAYLGTSSSVSNTDTVQLTDLIYHSYLLNRGLEELAESGEKEYFEGSVVDGVTFSYKKDYYLGDIVYVENEYGIGADARVTEVIEAVDENGYSVEPTFEYIS